MKSAEKQTAPIAELKNNGNLKNDKFLKVDQSGNNLFEEKKHRQLKCPVETSIKVFTGSIELIQWFCAIPAIANSILAILHMIFVITLISADLVVECVLEEAKRRGLSENKAATISLFVLVLLLILFLKYLFEEILGLENLFDQMWKLLKKIWESFHKNITDEKTNFGQ